MKKMLYDVEKIKLTHRNGYWYTDMTTDTKQHYDENQAMREYLELKEVVMNQIANGVYSLGCSINAWSWNEDDDDYTTFEWEKVTYKDHLETELELNRRGCEKNGTY